MDCRILPCYKLADVLAEVDKCCRQVEAEYGVKIEYTTPQKSESPATPVTAPVAQKLASAIKKVHNIDAKFIGIGGGTVGAELRREGIDAVVWSTLDDQAHQPNEYCIIDNLIKDAETLIEFFAN
jgi:succinyl-diaminopimelate desuccinylase